MSGFPFAVEIVNFFLKAWIFFAFYIHLWYAILDLLWIVLFSYGIPLSFNESRIGKDVSNTMGLMKKLFGDYSSRELKAIYPIVDKIEAMADEYKAMTDAQLQAKTPEFKE